MLTEWPLWVDLMGGNMPAKDFLIVGLTIIVLAGCGEGGGSSSSGGGSPPANTQTPPPTSPTISKGTLNGTLSVVNVTGAKTKAKRNKPASQQKNFIPGEIIIKFKDEITEAGLQNFLKSYQDISLTNAGQLFPEGPYLFHTDVYRNIDLSPEQGSSLTEQAIERLKKDPKVEYAEPNYVKKGSKFPSDPAFINSLQWNMRIINLPTAWEITTGSPKVIVAVVDSGIRPDHPEIASLLVPGFDFISDPLSSDDGDGIDSDPSDPLSPIAGFHGTHVAGTIAATSNDGKGITGVTWNTSIMPIRVLGIHGKGSSADIINGVRYAAGLSNSSGKFPEKPAKVINLSLGGSGGCSQAEQDTYTAVRNKGIVIVAAAGNEGDTGNPIVSPASCQGVIAVGAINPFFEHAAYSGFQPYVFISAPGGDDSNLFLSQILSTLRVSSSNDPLYTYYQGTSMATPHVSGIIALMLSENPSLTPTQVENIIANTALDLGAPGRDPKFGYGLINAGDAVAAAAGVLTPVIPVAYAIPNLLFFSDPSISPELAQAVVFNTGGGNLTLSNPTLSQLTPVGGSWLKATLSQDPNFCIAATNCIVNATANRTGLQPDFYTGQVNVTTSVELFAIPVVLQVGSPPLPDLGRITVRLISLDPNTKKYVVTATTTTDKSKNYQFSFTSIPIGDYFVDAGIDSDGSGFFGDAPDEVSGVFPDRGAPDTVTVNANQTVIANFPITDQQVIIPIKE